MVSGLDAQVRGTALYGIILSSKGVFCPSIWLFLESLMVEALPLPKLALSVFLCGFHTDECSENCAVRMNYVIYHLQQLLIARKFGIAVFTVKCHVTPISKKTGASSRIDLAVRLTVVAA